MKVVKIAAIAIGAAVLIGTGIGAVGALAGGASLGAAIGGGFLGTTLAAGSALGISWAAATAIAVGALAIDLSMASKALMPKPSGGGSQTKWKADPYAGIPYVMGRTLTSGNIVYRRGHGSDNKYNTFVTILSLGAIASIDATFMDKTLTGFAGGGAAVGVLSGQAWQKTQLGAAPEPAALAPPIGSPPGWTPAHKLSGLAAAMNSFAYDAKKSMTSIPQPAWIVHGVKVYDPRLDSTYPGGSGPCRAYAEDTYVYSENPELHGLTWALGRYHNGRRVAGIGPGNAVPAGPVRGIDVASFVEGANLSDARGWKLGGQVYTRPDAPWNSLKAMCQAGGSTPVLVGGQIFCLTRAPKVSLATITRDDIVGKVTFAGTQPRRARPNTIIPQYRSEDHDWEMVPASAVSVPDFVALDGDERTREMAYQLVQDVTQATQLAALDIYDLREAGPGTVPLKPYWLNYRIGDCLTFAPEDGWSIKAVIGGRGIDGQSGAVTYTLRGETDGKHAYALGRTGTPPPIATLGYASDVPAPDLADWAVTGETLIDNGAGIPALVAAGAIGNVTADAAIWDFRVYVAGAGADDNWIAAGVEGPHATRKEIAGVTPGTQYEVSVRYRVRGRIGARRIYGPVTAGALYPPGYFAQLISTSYPTDADPMDGLLQATTSVITIETHTRTYSDREVSVTGGTLAVDDTGAALTADTWYQVYYDDADRVGGAVTFKATTDSQSAATSSSNPARHYVGPIKMDVAGGTGTSGGGSTPPGWQYGQYNAIP